MAEDTHYEVLGIEPSATPDEVRATYKRLIFRVHPDQGGNDALFRRVEEAFRVLSDPKRRADYDTLLREGNSKSSSKRDSNRENPQGWVRVDEPPPTESSTSWTNTSSAGYNSQYGPNSSSSSNPRDTFQANNRFFERNPWAFLLIAGFLFVTLFGAASGFVGVGFLMILAGVVAVIGSTRANRKLTASHAGILDIDVMSGPSFENYLAELFSVKGYDVQTIGQVGNFGADLILSKHGFRTVVQAKRCATNVGVDGVREVAAARVHYQANYSMVVTNSHFTGPALQLAKSNGVLLWDREVLSREAAVLSTMPSTKGMQLLSAQMAAGISIVAKVAGIAILGELSRRSRRRRTWHRR